MSANSQNSALEKLKKLVYRGYLEKTVDVDGVKISLKTLSVQEELSVLEDSGLSNPPANAKEAIKYIPAVLSYAIFKIDGEPVAKDQIKDLLNSANAPSLLAKLYDAYRGLEDERAKAGDELKNS
jgi:hypothetical protein